MTAIFSSPRITILTDEDHPTLHAFLNQDAPGTVYLRSMAHEFPVSPTQDVAHGRFFGAWKGQDLKAVAFAGNSHNLSTFGDQEFVEPLLKRVEKAPVVPQLFVGPEDHAEAVRKFFSRAGFFPKLDRRQYSYVLDRPYLGDTEPLPLRKAEPNDTHQVLDAHAAMIEEDLKIPRNQMNMTRLEQITRRRIGQDKIWIHESRGALIFKTEEVSRSAEGVLAGGVYTHPKHRSKGYAARGMAAWAMALFETHIERLTLHVDATNQPAIKAYERVGFSNRDNLRLILCM